MPTISVVIPAYNAESTILETIKSVQQQTFSDLEIIVINDGSTDQTLKLLRGIEDYRLKVFSYENGGLPLARNRGIFHATGEFISFIDADDLWTSDKLESQFFALQKKPKAGVAYSWTTSFVDGKKKAIFPYKPIYYEGNVYNKLLINNIISNGSNILIRKQVIDSVGQFDSSLKSCEDWDFYIRAAAQWNFVLVPKHQILYRQSASAMTSKVEIIEQEALKVINKAYQLAPSEYQILKKQSLAWIYEYCTQQHLKHGNNLNEVKKASQKLWLAIRLHPPILLDDYGQTLIQWLLKKWVRTILFILTHSKY